MEPAHATHALRRSHASSTHAGAHRAHARHNAKAAEPSAMSVRGGASLSATSGGVAVASSGDAPPVSAGRVSDVNAALKAEVSALRHKSDAVQAENGSLRVSLESLRAANAQLQTALHRVLQSNPWPHPQQPAHGKQALSRTAAPALAAWGTSAAAPPSTPHAALYPHSARAFTRPPHAPLAHVAMSGGSATRNVGGMTSATSLGATSGTAHNQSPMLGAPWGATMPVPWHLLQAARRQAITAAAAASGSQPPRPLAGVVMAHTAAALPWVGGMGGNGGVGVTPGGGGGGSGSASSQSGTSEDSARPRTGKMDRSELERVEDFIRKVKSGELKVTRGSLARRLRQHVNPARRQVFYEKLVTRRRLNPELATWLRAKHTSGSGGSSGASTSRDGDTSDTPTASPTTSHTSDTSERASSSTNTVNGHHSSAARDAHGRRESTRAPASHSDGSSTCRPDSSTSSGGSDGDTRGHSGGGGGDGSSGHALTAATAHKASHSGKASSRSKAFRRHRPPTCEGDSDATQEWPLASAATDLVGGHSAYTDSGSRRASKRRRRAHASARGHGQRSSR